MAAKSVRGDIALMFVSTAATQIIGFAATPFLTRAFDPRAFGAWALILNAGAIIGSVGGLRFELAIPVADSEVEARDLLRFALFAAAIIAVLGGLAVLALPIERAGVVGWGHRLEIALCVTAVAVLSSSGQIVILWGVRTGAFAGLAAFRVVQGIIAALSPLLLGLLMGYHQWALAAGWVVGQVAAFFTLRSAWRATSGLADWREDSARIIGTVKKFWATSISLLNYGVLETARDRALFLVVGLFGTREAGLFALAMRLAYAPASLVSSSLSSVVFNRASSTGVQSLERPIAQALLWLVRLSTPAACVAAVSATIWVPRLLGPQWRDGAIYIMILMPPAWTVLNVSWIDRLWVASGNQRRLLHLTLGLSGVLAATCLLELWIGFDATAVVASYAAIFSIYMIVWTVALLRACGYGLVKFRSIAVESAILTLVWCGVAALALQSGDVKWWILVGLCLTGYYVVVIRLSIRAFSGLSFPDGESVASRT